MKIINCIDFNYVIEHEDEFFEFEFEDEFLENIAEQLDVEDFQILKADEISENRYNVTILSNGEEHVFQYTIPEEKVRYIKSITQ